MIGEAVERATDRIGERLVNIVRSHVLKVILAVVSFIFLLGIIVCGCIAIFWYLTPIYGPMMALAIVASGLGLACLCFGAAAMLTGREVTIADTVEPAEVVEEESREIVDAVGPYKLVTGALVAGALLGGGLNGGRAVDDESAAGHSGTAAAASTMSSVLSLIPTAVPLLTLFNSNSNGASNDPLQPN